MFGVGAQQDMHIPGKKGSTCQQPERKFLAKGTGKEVGVGMSRCEKCTYTERDRDRSFFKLGPTCPPPTPQHWCQAFLPAGLTGSPTP